jgi:type 1 glutamine amidotransferase
MNTDTPINYLIGNNFNSSKIKQMKLNKIFFACLFCVVALLILSPVSSYAQGNTSLKGKKVLFVFGGWDGHQPKECRDLFVPWMESEGAEVFVFDSPECYANVSLMSKMDLVIQVFTQGKISGEAERGLLNAVKRGVGIAGWHGGLGDSFRENTEFQYLVGGQWVAHPGGSIQYDVKITDKKDPVTQGLKDFHMQSEQYYMHVDPNVKVLATTKYTGEHNDWIAGAVIPVVWKKSYGKGRVFYSSLAHSVKDFDVPEALEIMKRGIRWASVSLYEPSEKWVTPVY